MNIEGLIAELKNDPLARGYSSKTDAQAFADLTSLATGRTKNLTALSAMQVYNAIVPSELQALSGAQQWAVRDLYNLGDNVNVSPGTNARTTLLNAFGPATVTRANLSTLVTVAISRAEEIGCPDLTLFDVTYLRQVNNLPHP